ncbi:MAG: Lrp/AsnC ligand binding domain-containing protein [Deltaproteobacteria bacterium]|nr:Lrp/AsnC ligand binding domain-containing protein [Deltaproteobacteria bacterium]MBW1872236.1 Lrp/AsnC ligand binding domain-containing protein [Deltaproteobacteria bacterium]
MAARAYILIEGAAGTVPSILKKISSTDGVKTAHAVTGQYDLIALVEAEDVNAVGKISYSKIQMIEGVIRTITCNVIDLE